MEEKDVIQMSVKELKRCWIIQKAIEKRITQKKALELIGISDRHARRLLKRFRIHRERGLIHGLRGKTSNRTHSPGLKEKILKLYEREYKGFGPTLASEKLFERNKIKINRETLRQWLMDGKFWERRRSRKKHLQWRERKACFGEMVQMDGSHHDWLEGRGEKLVLMAYVDDATGNVFAKFYDYEGTYPAMESFYLYVKRYGLPQSIYLDCHTTYKSNGKLSIQDELAGKPEPKSKFERALESLEVRVIHAHSPQAKGRVERQFSTFQDRLVKEMRLAKINSKEEANHFLSAYLPKYNVQFKRCARNSVDLHQNVSDTLLKRALSIQETHPLRNDNTVRHQGMLYLIKERFLWKKPKHITVEERLNQKLYFMDGNRSLAYCKLKEPAKEQSKPTLQKTPKQPRKPIHAKADHPWHTPFHQPSFLKASRTDHIYKTQEEPNEVSSLSKLQSIQERELIHT